MKRILHKAKQRAYLVYLHMYGRVFGEKLPYYCPCCETNLKKFIDGGYTSKPDRFNPARYEGFDQFIKCPVCRSIPRHRIIALWLNDHKDWLKDKRIMHFAAERCLKQWFDRNGVKYTTADLFAAADFKLNLEDTGLEEGSCDLIICNHVLEHVSDYKKALRELHRILSPDGKLIISFPIDPVLDTVWEDESFTTEEERFTHFGQANHLRVFGTDSADILRKFDFNVTEVRGDDCDPRIKPVIGPANYDSNVIFCCSRK